VNLEGYADYPDTWSTQEKSMKAGFAHTQTSLDVAIHEGMINFLYWKYATAYYSGRLQPEWPSARFLNGWEPLNYFSWRLRHLSQETGVPDIGRKVAPALAPDPIFGHHLPEVPRLEAAVYPADVGQARRQSDIRQWRHRPVQQHRLERVR